MGHAVNYLTYPEKTDKREFFADAYQMADLNGDSGYHGNLKIHNIVYDSYQDAKEAIEGFDTGYYSDHAVKYLDYSSCQPTKTMEGIKSRIEKLSEQKRKYLDEHSVRKQKAVLISCRNCGSKISKSWLKTEFCPVCRADLRAEYIREKLSDFDRKETALKKEYALAEKKLKTKAKVKWLVKIEYHT